MVRDTFMQFRNDADAQKKGVKCASNFKLVAVEESVPVPTGPADGWQSHWVQRPIRETPSAGAVQSSGPTISLFGGGPHTQVEASCTLLQYSNGSV